MSTNERPFGRPVPDWSPRRHPPRSPLEGRLVHLEPLNADRHAAELFAANALDAAGDNWAYLPYGPYAAFDDYRAWVAKVAAASDPLFHAIVDRDTNEAVGVASLMRIDPANGVIEIGHLNFSPLLQQRPGATEALFLLLRRVFDELGYRRCEWKCNSLNQRSRAAALRLGFTYEGLFRQAVVVKGRNRDTTWFSIIDGDWPTLRPAYEAWLAPENFEADGRQKQSLRDLMAGTR